ncbi:DnaA N-terminal domain-containing protein [Metabacillus herbersteinensis]|uniref:DnaA N-terminal domain-containing protein n=1 Tax=Metabacillus herbersteinensis TaxID=283816 RepID=A0ABV6GIE3_9BACI
MNQQIWKQVLQIAAERISKPSFETWLKSSNLVTIDEKRKTATVSVENEFCRDWVDVRYKSLLENILNQITNTVYTIIVISTNSNNLTTEPDPLGLPINKNYTFSTFSENQGNQYSNSSLNGRLETEKSSTTYTKELLEKILIEQKRTNELLEKIVTLSTEDQRSNPLE